RHVVHTRLVEERADARGVLLLSLELEEVLSISDRILVMYEGEIVGEFPPTATEEELGIAMTDGGRGEAAPRPPPPAPPPAGAGGRGRRARPRPRHADRRADRAAAGELGRLHGAARA